MKTKSRLIVAALAAVAMAAVTAPIFLGSQQAQADDQLQDGLPLGMANFTVAVGEVNTSITTNWNRLGTYTFSDDGTVSEEHWHWSQSRRDARTGTGVQGSDCPSRDCEIYTANGYESSSAPDSLDGVFEVDGDTLRIEWDQDDWWEEWTLSVAVEDSLAKLEFLDASFGATHGFGYGSNADHSERATPEEIHAEDHTEFNHRYYLWKTEGTTDPIIDEGSGGPFWMTDWEVCGGGDCLGGLSDTTTEYYVSHPHLGADDRRDTLWHWRTHLADDRGEYCYTGNSHVKPMMQIIDSNGNFHGWVGVEAFINHTTDNGAYDDHFGVFEIARHS